MNMELGFTDIQGNFVGRRSDMMSTHLVPSSQSQWITFSCDIWMYYIIYVGIVILFVATSSTNLV